jgi:hypothetical protein
MYRGLSNDARLGDSFLELFGYPSIRYRMALMVLLYFLQCVMFGSVLWFSFLLFNEIVSLYNSTAHDTADTTGEATEQIVVGYWRYYLLSCCWCVITLTGCYLLFTRIDRFSVRQSEQHQPTMNENAMVVQTSTPPISKIQNSIPSTPLRNRSITDDESNELTQWPDTPILSNSESNRAALGTNADASLVLPYESPLSSCPN